MEEEDPGLAAAMRASMRDMSGGGGGAPSAVAVAAHGSGGGSMGPNEAAVNLATHEAIAMGFERVVVEPWVLSPVALERMVCIRKECYEMSHHICSII